MSRGAHTNIGGKRKSPRKKTKRRKIVNMLLRGVTASELFKEKLITAQNVQWRYFYGIQSSYGYDIRSIKFRSHHVAGHGGVREHVKYFIVGFDRPCGRYRSLTHDYSMKI